MESGASIAKLHRYVSELKFLAERQSQSYVVRVIDRRLRQPTRQVLWVVQIGKERGGVR